MPETDPIGWRGLVYGTPVTSIDGDRVGTVREVLGSDADRTLSPGTGDLAAFCG